MPAERVLAAALVEPGKYELREYPLPEPAPGCVLVKMELSGICGTDKHPTRDTPRNTRERAKESRSVSPSFRVTKT